MMTLRPLLLALIASISPLLFGGISTADATLFDIGFKKLNFVPIHNTEAIKAEIIHRKNFKETHRSVFLVSGRSLTKCNMVYGSLMGKEPYYIKCLDQTFVFDGGHIGNPRINDYESPELSVITFPVTEKEASTPSEIEIRFKNITFGEANTLIRNSSLVKRRLAANGQSSGYMMPQTTFILIEEEKR